MSAALAVNKRVKRRAVRDDACASVACKDCGLYRLCLTAAGDVDIGLLDGLVKNRRTFKRGELLYSVGAPHRAAYAIRRGAVKTSVLTDDGRTQVAGFHISGEVLGLNAIVNDRYNCEARALEATSVCEVSFEQYEDMVLKMPGIQRQMLKILGEEIIHNQEMMLLLGKKRAEERLATFFVNLSRRLAHHGRPAEEFKLSMSRSDIGNYLGLAEETVCRIISRFEDKSLISTERRLVRLGQTDRLLAMSRGSAALD